MMSVLPAAMLAVAVALSMPASVPASESSLTLSALAAGIPCSGGKSVLCVDSRTVALCGNTGSGPQIVATVPCSGTWLCYDGRCLQQQPTTDKPSTAEPTPSGPTAAPTPSPPHDPSQACGGKASECADCHSRTLCSRMSGRLVPEANETCGGDTPFCVDGECVADLPANSSCRPPAPPEDTFRCHVSGYFPDPADCTKYHLCVGNTSYDYDCGAVSPGLVYDHKRAFCVPAESAECFTFDCRGKVGRYITYGPEQSVYALCVSEDSRDALVSSCPLGQRLKFIQNDPLTVQCEPYCPRAGRFRDPEGRSDQYFLECFESPAGNGGAGLIGPLKGYCYSGFNADMERCHFSLYTFVWL